MTMTNRAPSPFTENDDDDDDDDERTGLAPLEIHNTRQSTSAAASVDSVGFERHNSSDSDKAFLRSIAVLVCFTLVGFIIVLMLTQSPVPAYTTSGRTKVKVMSYNIDNSGKRPQWKNVVKEENPDIAVFVEVGTWDDDNNKLLNQYVSEFNNYFSSSKPYHGSVTQNTGVPTTGCALMSRYPILSTSQIDSLRLRNGSTFRPTHSVMVWSINVDGRVVYVCGLHGKCCPGFEDDRDRTMEGFINYLDTLGDVPLVIMGDFNSLSPSDVNRRNPDYNKAFRPANGGLGDGPLTMLLYPRDKSYGRYSSRGVHTFTDTFRKVNNDCGASRGHCCLVKARKCAYKGGQSSCMERGFTYHNGKDDSRIDFIIANQLIQVVGPSTVGDTASACDGSDHFTVDNYLVL